MANPSVNMTSCSGGVDSPSQTGMRPEPRFYPNASFVLLTVALAGCAAHHRAETARRAQTDLVGYTKAQSCAGAPTRSERSQDIEVMTYVGGGDSAGAVVGTSPGSFGVGVTSSRRRYCEVSFVLRDGMVEKVNYTGRTGGYATQGEQCAFVVENCVRRDINN